MVITREDISSSSKAPKAPSNFEHLYSDSSDSDSDSDNEFVKTLKNTLEPTTTPTPTPTPTQTKPSSSSSSKTPRAPRKQQQHSKNLVFVSENVIKKVKDKGINDKKILGLVKQMAILETFSESKTMNEFFSTLINLKQEIDSETLEYVNILYK